MESTYFKKVQENMLFYKSEIQKDLQLLEVQYKALGEPDLFLLEKPLNEFIDKEFLNLLSRLETSVQQLTDQILPK
jgi:hypothetical protein